MIIYAKQARIILRKKNLLSLAQEFMDVRIQCIFYADSFSYLEEPMRP
uniref:Uncharacterized protein n=1 Tax=Nelumbo nucifera TaxID=4432 RepID=A0A822ZEK0_NELNU|nr:TPA_asm: hypothetical protein HUJ06_001223 [Nelumbo nucifera]